MDTELQVPPVRVSVVIPTYNRAADVGRALDSVLSQTYPATEVIVVDDGSTDNTEEVVARFGSRVTYIRQPNSGVSAARNRGFRVATGEWIAFLDSDDWWLPEKIQLQIEALRGKPGAVLVYTSAWIISPDGTRELAQAAAPERLWPAMRCSNRIISCSSVMVRRDVLIAEGGFNQALSGSEDWDLWVRLVQKHRFAFVSEPVIAYVITPNSLCQNPERNIADAERMLESPLLDGLRGMRRRIWRRRIRAAQVFHAAVVAREIDPAYGGRLLLRSLVQWPSPFFLFKRWKVLAAYILRRKFGRPLGPAPPKAASTSTTDSA